MQVESLPRTNLRGLCAISSRLFSWRATYFVEDAGSRPLQPCGLDGRPTRGWGGLATCIWPVAGCPFAFACVNVDVLDLVIPVPMHHDPSNSIG